MAENELNLLGESEARPPGLGGGGPAPVAALALEPFDPNKDREQTRGDLARGLLWLLTFAVGGVLVFIGLGRLEGSVLAQSIFPSLIALAGTALGFYFGSQSPVAGIPSSSRSPGLGGPPIPPPPNQPPPPEVVVAHVEAEPPPPPPVQPAQPIEGAQPNPPAAPEEP